MLAQCLLRRRTLSLHFSGSVRRAFFASWEGGYSPESILARVNRPRQRVRPDSIHAVPPKSEEDVWFEQQAPGYDVDRSVEPTVEQMQRWKGHKLWEQQHTHGFLFPASKQPETSSELERISTPGIGTWDILNSLFY